jgi:hypothetical protein
MLKMAFSFIKAQIDRDAAKYAAVCEKNRENIQRRWKKEDAEPIHFTTSFNECGFSGLWVLIPKNNNMEGLK